MSRKKKAKESVSIEYIDEVLEKGISALEEIILRKSMMNQTAKDTAEITGVSKAELIKMKDYIYYRGRGWGNDALDKEDTDGEDGEAKEKYPDKMAIFTEGCIEKHQFRTPVKNAERYAHDMIGNTPLLKKE